MLSARARSAFAYVIFVVRAQFKIYTVAISLELQTANNFIEFGGGRMLSATTVDSKSLFPTVFVVEEERLSSATTVVGE